MASNYFAKGLKRSALTIALGMCFVGGVQAQTNTGGNVVGSATPGDTITITGVDTGFKRELKIDKDGKYQIRRVPTGEYHVVRAHNDGTIDPVQGVVVRPGGTARVMTPGKTEAKDVFSGS